MIWSRFCFLDKSMKTTVKQPFRERRENLEQNNLEQIICSGAQQIICFVLVLSTKTKWRAKFVRCVETHEQITEKQNICYFCWTRKQNICFDRGSGKQNVEQNKFLAQQNQCQTLNKQNSCSANAWNHRTKFLLSKNGARFPWTNDLFLLNRVQEKQISCWAKFDQLFLFKLKTN